MIREELDRISKDIKKSEKYLNDFPLTRDRVVKGLPLFYDKKKSRICFSIKDGDSRPLAEMPLQQRIEAYLLLPRFIKEVVQQEENELDVSGIRESSKSLNEMFSKEK